MAVDSKALVSHNGNGFSDERRALIRKMIAPTVTPDEFEMFIERCRQTGLDPIARQIYAISRYDAQAGGNKMTIQVSIDGMRLLAERTGKYAGQLGPQWCGKDGKWQDVWLSDEPPVAARVGVLRSDFKEPLWSVARYSSYVQRTKDGKPTAMWARFPDVLLAKCAESLSIRRACPAETSGFYTREEMMQAESEQAYIDAEYSDFSEQRQPVRKPTEARPGEVRNAPASPADAAAATEQQVSSIRKLCERLSRPEPDDLNTLSFADAKVRIGILTEEYRTGKASQPASVPAQPQAEQPARPTPEDVERMKAYMGRVYNFKQKDFEARWQACKVHVLGKPVADPDLSTGDLAALRRFAGEREKEQLSAASVGGK